MPHTPGPWRIIEDKGALNEAYWIGPEPFHSICEVRNGAEDEEYGGEETEIANARLIAAAPDLLEALLDILPFAQHELAHIIPTGDKQEVQRRVVNALEAIAKAKA